MRVISDKIVTIDYPLLEQLEDFVFRDVSVVVQIVYAETENNPIVQIASHEYIESHDPWLQSNSSLDLSIPTAEQTFYQSVLRDHMERVVKQFTENAPIDTLNRKLQDCREDFTRFRKKKKKYVCILYVSKVFI